MSSFEVLIDSDAFVGRFFPDDAHHQKASQQFEELRNRRIFAVTTSMVLDEVATVLSHLDGQDLAQLFLKTMKEAQFPTIHVDERLRQEGVEVFLSQSRRGTSITDCVNVAVMRRFAIPSILAFDKVYTRDFQLSAW
jgi:predicted nucleic acid-binding protein